MESKYSLCSFKEVHEVRDSVVLSLSRSRYPSSSIDPRGPLGLAPGAWFRTGQMFGCPYALSGDYQQSMNALRVAYVVNPCIASFSFIIIQLNLN